MNQQHQRSTSFRASILNAWLPCTEPLGDWSLVIQYFQVGWHRNLFRCDASHKRFKTALKWAFYVSLLRTSSAQVQEPGLPKHTLGTTDIGHLPLHRLIVALLVGIWLTAPNSVSATEKIFDDARAVQSAGEALRQSASYPWYDAEHDALRDVRALRSGSDDSETREKGWQATAQPTKPPAPPTVPTGSWFSGWNWGFSFAGLMQYAAMTLLAIAIIVLVVLLVRYFLEEEEIESAGRNGARENDNAKAANDSVRLENLPFVVRERNDDPLAIAQRWYAEGRFSEAIIYLFAYQLMQLDRHQWIHLAKGKTNRQYLREVRQNAALRGITEHTMIAFEDVFFGKHPLPRERFEACWQRLDQFHKLLEQGVAA
jgi:hypothetical protein